MGGGGGGVEYGFHHFGKFSGRALGHWDLNSSCPVPHELLSPELGILREVICLHVILGYRK